MKRISMLLLLVQGLVAGVQAQLRFNSFESVWTYTLAHNPNLAISRKQVEQSSSALTAAKSILLPQIGINAAFQDNLFLPVTPIPAEFLGGEAGSYVETRFGQKYSYNAYLTANLSLLDMGAWAALKQSKLSQQLSQVNQQLTEQQIRAQLASAYYLALLAQHIYELTLQNKLSSDTLLLLAKQRFEKGLTDEITYNTIGINHISVEDNLEANKNAVENNLYALKMLMGIPLTENITLTEHIEQIAPKANKTFTLFPGLQLRQSDLLVQLATSALLESKYQFLPRISAFGNLGFQDNNDAFFSGMQWNQVQNWGVRIDIPLFTGFARSANKQKHSLELQITQAEQQRIQLEAATEDEKLITEYRQAYSALLNSQQILQLQSKNLELSRQKLEKGLLTLDYYLEVLTDQLNRQQVYVTRMAEYLVAKAKIDIRTL